MGYYADPGQLNINIPDVFGGMGKGDALSYVSTAWYFVALIAAVVVEVTVYYFLIRRFKLYRGKYLAKMRKRLIREAEAEKARKKHLELNKQKNQQARA